MQEKELEELHKWEFFLRNISEFVQLANIKGIKFIVRTNENGNHHKPHLHVEISNGASMSIAIEDGEILALSGKILPSQIKMAQEWMQENNEMIVNNWNEFSNGFVIPAYGN